MRVMNLNVFKLKVISILTEDLDHFIIGTFLSVGGFREICVKFRLILLEFEIKTFEQIFDSFVVDHVFPKDPTVILRVMLLSSKLR